MVLAYIKYRIIYGKSDKSRIIQDRKSKRKDVEDDEIEREKDYKTKGKTDNIIKMLQSIPGKVFFKYQKMGHGGYSFKFEKSDFITVNSFIWLFSWATEIIEKVHYLQLDASFV